MWKRCTQKNRWDYKDYGGRGITICEEWKDFKIFSADMGERPSGLSLDRIDNDKGYYKENCRWATPKQQRGNSRPLSNNRSGLTGVCALYSKSGNVRAWRAYGNREELYWGPDFFEACCARKSWENRQRDLLNQQPSKA